MKCAVCSREADGEWINPSNPKDRGFYCKEHLQNITKAYGCFCELVMLHRVTGGKLP